MTKRDYELLTILLDELGKELKADRYCIIPYYIHDGCHIGVYNTNGELLEAVTAPNIRDAVKKLKS